jgi:hypothetical protein
VLVHVASPFLLSPERGARTQVWLASSPNVRGVTGKYFARCKERTPSRAAREPEAPRRLWEVSEQMTGLGGERPLVAGRALGADAAFGHAP